MYNVILIAGVFILLILSVYITDIEKRMKHCEQRLFPYWTDVPYTINTAGAKTPTKAHPGDAGFDLHSDADCIIPAHGRALVTTGVSLQIPEGHYGLVTGRSGLTIREGIFVAPGIIDSNYRGNIGLMAFNTTDCDFIAKQGERLGQIIIMPYLDCVMAYDEKLSYTDRGNKGFGSSGN